MFKMAAFGTAKQPTVTSKFLTSTGTSTLQRVKTAQIEVLTEAGISNPLNMSSLTTLSNLDVGTVQALSDGAITGTGAQGPTGPAGSVQNLSDIEDVSVREQDDVDDYIGTGKVQTLHYGENSWKNAFVKLDQLKDVQNETEMNVSGIDPPLNTHDIFLVKQDTKWVPKNVIFDGLKDVEISLASQSLTDPTAHEGGDKNVEVIHRSKTTDVDGVEKDHFVNKTISLNNLDNVVTSTFDASVDKLNVTSLSALHFDESDLDDPKWVRRSIELSDVGDVAKYLTDSVTSDQHQRIIPKKSLLHLIGKPSELFSYVPATGYISAFDRDGYYPLYLTNPLNVPAGATSIIDNFILEVRTALIDLGFTEEEEFQGFHGETVTLETLEDKFVVEVLNTWNTETEHESNGASGEYFWLRYNHTSSGTTKKYTPRNDVRLADGVTSLAKINFDGDYDKIFDGAEPLFKVEKSITATIAEHGDAIQAIMSVGGGGDSAGGGNALLEVINALGDVTGYIGTASVHRQTSSTITDTLGNPADLAPRPIFDSLGAQIGTEERTILQNIGNLNQLRTDDTSSLVAALNEHLPPDDAPTFPGSLKFNGVAATETLVPNPLFVDQTVTPDLDEEIVDGATSDNPKAIITEGKLAKLLSNTSNIAVNDVVQNPHKIMTRKAVHEFVKSQLSTGDPQEVLNSTIRIASGLNLMTDDAAKLEFTNAVSTSIGEEVEVTITAYDNSSGDISYSVAPASDNAQAFVSDLSELGTALSAFNVDQSVDPNVTSQTVTPPTISETLGVGSLPDIPNPLAGQPGESDTIPAPSVIDAITSAFTKIGSTPMPHIPNPNAADPPTAENPSTIPAPSVIDAVQSSLDRIGVLSALSTNSKSNLVSAINEVSSTQISGGGPLAFLAHKVASFSYITASGDVFHSGRLVKDDLVKPSVATILKDDNLSQHTVKRTGIVVEERIPGVELQNETDAVIDHGIVWLKGTTENDTHHRMFIVPNVPTINYKSRGFTVCQYFTNFDQINNNPTDYKVSNMGYQYYSHSTDHYWIKNNMIGFDTQFEIKTQCDRDHRNDPLASANHGSVETYQNGSASPGAMDPRYPWQYDIWKYDPTVEPANVYSGNPSHEGEGFFSENTQNILFVAYTFFPGMPDDLLDEDFGERISHIGRQGADKWSFQMAYKFDNQAEMNFTRKNEFQDNLNDDGTKNENLSYTSNPDHLGRWIKRHFNGRAWFVYGSVEDSSTIQMPSPNRDISVDEMAVDDLESPLRYKADTNPPEFVVDPNCDTGPVIVFEHALTLDELRILSSATPQEVIGSFSNI